MLAVRSRSRDPAGKDRDLSAVRSVGVEVKCPESVVINPDGVHLGGARVDCAKTETHSIVHAAKFTTKRSGHEESVEVSIYWRTEGKKP